MRVHSCLNIVSATHLTRAPFTEKYILHIFYKNKFEFLLVVVKRDI